MWFRRARPAGDRQGDELPHRLRLLPAVERSPLVRSEHEDGVVGWLVTEEVHGVGVVVEPELRVRQMGEREARWILLDYLDCVVHVFTPEAREYYRLEQLWGEVPVRSVG